MRIGRLLICLLFSYQASSAVDQKLLEEAGAPNLGPTETLEILGQIEVSNLSTRESGQYYYYEGWAYREQKKFPKSLDSFLKSYMEYRSTFWKSQKDTKNIVDVLINVTDILYTCGAYDEAVEYGLLAFDKMRTLNESNKQKTAFKIFYLLGASYAEDGDLKQGLDNLDLARRHANFEGDSVKTENMIGDLLIKNETYDLADRVLSDLTSKKVITKKGTRYQGFAFKNLARVRLIQGDTALAITLLNKSIPKLLERDRFYVFSVLGEVALGKGDPENAIKLFNEAIELPYKTVNLERIEVMNHLAILGNVEILELQRSEIALLKERQNEILKINRRYAVEVLAQRWFEKEQNKRIITLLVSLTALSFCFVLYSWWKKKKDNSKVDRSLSEIDDLTNLSD